VIRVSRGIIKLVQGMESDLDSYRYYCIARHHYAHHSGIFSLDAFCDLLHTNYNYASLHRRPGNDRRRFKERLADILRGSLLFSELSDGRYKINSEKKLLSKYNKGHNMSMWFELPDVSILSSKRKFFDFCVGVLLAGNKFRANSNIAESCRVTVRRIQFATAQNHKNGTFIKHYNFIEDFTGSYDEVERFRAMLFNVHGISSPLPRKHKKEWIMRLNAPNTYRATMLCGVKGDRAQPLEAQGTKKGCWFIPAIEKDKQRKLFCKSSGRRWFFNKELYNIGSYLVDHSRLLS